MQEKIQFLINTYSGQQADLGQLQPGVIDINDIAHSLAYQCRYNGHVKKFYSVAEHSLYLALLVPKMFRNYVLLKDAYQCYYGFMSTPFKFLVSSDGTPLQNLIMAADRAIMQAFELDYKKFTEVKRVIQPKAAELYNVEVDILQKGLLINFPSDNPLAGAPFGMSPAEAEAAYLNTWHLHK